MAFLLEILVEPMIEALIDATTELVGEIAGEIVGDVTGDLVSQPAIEEFSSTVFNDSEVLGQHLQSGAKYGTQKLVNYGGDKVKEFTHDNLQVLEDHLNGNSESEYGEQY